MKYLLEIGTEELPYKFISSALNQLKDSLSKILEENKIEFKDIKTYGTPRRLCVIIDGISESQPDQTLEIKGPPANIAFDASGNLTQAALGFAKKQGLSPEILGKKEIAGVEYLYASIKQEGKPTEDVLKDIIPEMILKIQGTRFMRWADLDIKFSRPIRWLVSILDNKEIKFKIGNAESSQYSRGHRFSQNKQVKIESPDTYLENLYNAQVIADPERRKQKIVSLINKAAASKGGVAKIPEELLDEVTNLVEWPTPVIGSFGEKYLEITEDVIVCVLAHHQRYFPIYDKDGKLLNYFITIANHDESNIDNIRKGNEKVVKPRLDDAIFFYKEDNKRTLASRVEDLKGVTFQKGLGTLYDKTQRIKQIAGFIACDLKLNDKTAEKAIRTAELCKADLVTNMVREFTELQGIIGGDYAKLNGEDELVSFGIREHYMPISSDGELAKTITGQVVGIADKIDTICGVFALGKAPTGSADPLGLRRAAIGIINTITDKKLNINLSTLIEKTVYVQPLEIENKVKLSNEIKDFITHRLKNLLTEEYRHDVVDAVLSAKDSLADLSDFQVRINIISELVKKDSYKFFHESANRIIRIIKNQQFDTAVKPELFVEEAENELWDCVSMINDNIDYSQLIEKLETCIPKIEKFFDKVLVMDKDEQIKNNRLNLLGNLNNKFLRIADFSKIVF
ncbi:MAG TPA: glycine--tRNA ligase subunit beta [Cyanobacteria bacterium UBA9971]|nr:glycine--tRNA ligase subunit beta [Cyanobacteria bacterium UBA9971]